MSCSIRYSSPRTSLYWLWLFPTFNSKTTGKAKNIVMPVFIIFAYWPLNSASCRKKLWSHYWRCCNWQGEPGRKMHMQKSVRDTYLQLQFAMLASIFIFQCTCSLSYSAKGQIVSKRLLVPLDSSKKWTNKFGFFA